MSRNNKKTNVLRAVRIAVAAVVFVLFLLVFINAGGLFSKALGWLPKLQFWPAVLAANVGVLVLLCVLTMVFGRVYCSFLCPLGILQDGIYRLRTSGPAKRRFRQKWSKPKNILRYSVLAVFLALICLGYGSYAYILEPYSLFGRMVTSFFGKSLMMAAVSAVLLAVIFFMVWKWGRAWCNTVCPVGSVLSVLSRWSLFRPTIDEDKCVGCGLCGKACRASCIDTVHHTVDMSRCVACFDCIGNCSGGAIKYKWTLPGQPPQPAKADGQAESQKSSSASANGASDGLSRRAFLGVSALALGSAAAKAEESASASLFAELLDKEAPKRNVPLVPPGAGSLKAYDAKCVSCQLCVSACPNHVLRPGTDLGTMLLQPVMSFEKGFCRPECTACSDVCPAGAIRPVTKEEKTTISIGHAVFVPDNCVVVTDAARCGNCARHCPCGAISMVKIPEDLGFGDGSLRIPSVNAERCIGCGHCEYVCPSRPLSAIYVEGNEVHRNI